MNLKECMTQLEAMGTAQNRKVYARHGVTGKQFGVSCGNYGKLKKLIKSDHELALKLWATANHDARIMATMIVEPKKLKSSEIDAWAKVIEGYPITDAFSGVVSKTPFVVKKMEQWTNRKGEWISSVGWNLVASLAQNSETLDDAFFEQQLERIEDGIHTAPNRTRHAMNLTLICIGCRNPKLEKKTLAVAKRIGKVEVDHGETGCKTPDAADYIKKTLAYRAKKKSKVKK